MLLNLNVKCTAPYMPAKKLQHLSIAVSTELLEDIDHILELYKLFRPSTSKSSKLLDNIVVFHPNFTLYRGFKNENNQFILIL